MPGPSRSPSPRPLRKRLRRRESPTGVRYLTCSCYHRRKLLGNPAIRDEVVRALFAARAKCGFGLLAWMVMPEHIHLMTVPRQTDLPVQRSLAEIKRPIAQQVIRRCRRLKPELIAGLTDRSGRAHFWQPGGGFDRAVRDIDELVREVNYIHHNPVKRGLVGQETAWAWSSARDYARLRALAAIHKPAGLLAHPERAAVPIDTARVDRYDFPEQCLASLWIDGAPCLDIGQARDAPNP